jgi:hypothetical protein
MYSHWMTLLIMIVIAIAAVGFILAALTVSTRGHDIYSRVVMECFCGLERLCEAVEVVVIEHAEQHRFEYNNQGFRLPAQGRGYYLPKSGEFIPESFAQPSPDERFHRCTYPLNEYWTGKAWAVLPNSSTFDGSPPTRCFFRPNIGA